MKIGGVGWGEVRIGEVKRVKVWEQKGKNELNAMR